ncbi:hypothetical protein B0A49_06489 [Cryomyces minteri]|uniref:Uncharacterized protein n=1 Tax=Cryomyces minteri TaxID=331657 RepID=A0A4U0WZ76_9PEZI|nr:hypothetical protein B0A49_06489 [Cryomyces minteri]
MRRSSVILAELAESPGTSKKRKRSPDKDAKDAKEASDSSNVAASVPSAESSINGSQTSFSDGIIKTSELEIDVLSKRNGKQPKVLQVTTPAVSTEVTPAPLTPTSTTRAKPNRAHLFKKKIGLKSVPEKVTKRLPGRRRAPNANPLIEADLRRQLQLKTAYRSVVKALKPVLAELAQRTSYEIENDPSAHTHCEEHGVVSAELCVHFNQRLAYLKTKAQLDEELLKRTAEAEVEVKAKQYEQAVRDLEQDFVTTLKRDFVTLVREVDRQDEDATDDEVRSCNRKQAMIVFLTSKQSGLIRPLLFVEMERLWDGFDKRYSFKVCQSDYDGASVTKEIGGFASFDRAIRDQAIAAWNIDILTEASYAVESQPPKPRIPVLSNSEATRLSVLAAISTADPAQEAKLREVAARVDTAGVVTSTTKKPASSRTKLTINGERWSGDSFSTNQQGNREGQQTVHPAIKNRDAVTVNCGSAGRTPSNKIQDILNRQHSAPGLPSLAAKPSEPIENHSLNPAKTWDTPLPFLTLSNQTPSTYTSVKAASNDFWTKLATKGKKEKRAVNKTWVQSAARIAPKDISTGSVPGSNLSLPARRTHDVADTGTSRTSSRDGDNRKATMPPPIRAPNSNGHQRARSSSDGAYAFPHPSSSSYTVQDLTGRHLQNDSLSSVPRPSYYGAQRADGDTTQQPLQAPPTSAQPIYPSVTAGHPPPQAIRPVSGHGQPPQHYESVYANQAQPLQWQSPASQYPTGQQQLSSFDHYGNIPNAQRFQTNGYGYQQTTSGPYNQPLPSPFYALPVGPPVHTPSYIPVPIPPPPPPQYASYQQAPVPPPPYPPRTQYGQQLGGAQPILPATRDPRNAHNGMPSQSQQPAFAQQRFHFLQQQQQHGQGQGDSSKKRSRSYSALPFQQYPGPRR